MKVLELLLPASCAGCGAPGDACCRQCLAVFGRPARVARGAVAEAAPVYALARYREIARRLVLHYKERGRRDLAAPLGEALAAAVPYLPEARPGADGVWWLVPAPSRRVASRVRGGPHLRRLAAACAAALARGGHAAAVAPALRLGPGARDAVGLSREQRQANLASHLRLDRRGVPPPGASVLLLDDVVTTGATAAAGIRILAAAGFPVQAVVSLTAS